MTEWTGLILSWTQPRLHHEETDRPRQADLDLDRTSSSFWTVLRISRQSASFPTAAPGGEASTEEKANDAQTYDGEDNDSEPEPDKEASDGAARAESPMITHLP
ncbi:hypothetical protein Bca52824_087108 [Brassica carinata]|uniref:Uncharacterized protein n=1 Tax=Brassica carinata TaxID=52824 RepID=A0A8X7PA12_BRACI|nr:hypothetical protein Bca52824_087108 [Brassica carinata]